MNIFDWTFFLVSKLIPIQVIVKEGVLEGDVVWNRYGSPYYSFKGIPYAEPPVGDLRFKAPIPKSPWAGVRNAKEHAPKCYQPQLYAKETQTPIGSEDCLYLNVYAPNIVPIKFLLPVMVWIHGGGFHSGSGNDDEQSPEYFMRKEVILVTLNYRLEVLAFLSLDTEDIPGNAGMKDQVAALRWVKENIQKFGGDPDNITIFGESAGGASVSFHLVSPMSKGLFKRAIAQSGALTCWWPITFRARDRALVLARKLGCSSKDDKEIYDCLLAQPVESLVSTKIKVTYVQSAKACVNVHFGIVSERRFGENERFFSGHPYDVLRNGIHEGVQVMNGYTEDEGTLYFLRADRDAEEVFEQANNFKEFFVPEPYTTNTTLVTQMEIGERFREFYLGDKTASKETVDEMMKYFNMEVFVYGIMALQKIVAKTTQESNNYLYKFTCKSELNQFARQTAIDSLFAHRPVVAHGGDLRYLFPLLPAFGPEIDMNSNTFKMINQVTTLWTNFAKYGNPTPDDSLGTKWLPYTIENQDYLVIGEDLVPGTFPEQEDVEFWEDNFKEHLPKLVP
ncbi:juvenile hormone esterase-like [Maniola jurtina]|uniref:juvenile hormone esterase-like n=1 Tax=Maniola jurtina TaxID=191418 RepID=UPI001E686E22|nr:juvenile hormone esterase-like [Maniola jurtina]